MTMYQDSTGRNLHAAKATQLASVEPRARKRRGAVAAKGHSEDAEKAGWLLPDAASVAMVDRSTDAAKVNACVSAMAPIVAKGRRMSAAKATNAVPDATPIAAKGRDTMAGKADVRMPDAASVRGKGHKVGAEKASLAVPDPRSSCEEGQSRDGAQSAVLAPDSQTIDGADQLWHAAKATHNVSVTVELLRQLQRRRRFAIKMQSKIDRGTEAYLATQHGYSAALPEKERREIFDRVGKLRRAVEKGEAAQGSHAEKAIANVSVSPHDIAVILASAKGRDAFDAMRQSVESEMRRNVRTLPIWQWAKEVRGLGELGVAIVIGEAGNLSLYPKKGHLWKRLGLAVIDGERQQRKSGKEAAAAHGYSPQRRSEMWVLADSMLRAQLRKQDEAQSTSLGLYGDLYLRRRATTEQREGWTKAHSHADAKRYMWKGVLKHMRAAWIADANF